MEPHKFNIGDVVYIQSSNRPWFVIGVAMRPCHDMILWEYRIGQAVYGNHPMSAFGSRCDVNVADNMREEQLTPEADWLEQQKAILQAEIEQAEKRLAELKEKQKQV
jgi:hypothetical protein